jgi:hypothetical protein
MSDTNTSQRDPDAKIRLARIFISDDGIHEYEWDGKEPNPGDTLFVYYVKVSDETYRENIPLDAFRQEHIVKLESYETPQSKELYTMEKRTFEQLRGIKNDVTISYLHNTNNDRHNNRHTNIELYGDIEKRQAELLPYLMSKGNIFQNRKDFSCWYELNGPDAYSGEYYRYSGDYDFLDLRVIDDHGEFNREYTVLQTYVQTKVDRHVLFRETGGSESCFRCIKKKQGGGGKTRRKFKVKKRRNRRIRNTMKRRKTALKRRKGRKSV